MKAAKWTLASAVFCIFAASAAADSSDASISHFEPLQSLSIQSVGADGSQKLSGSSTVNLQFDALGQRFDLDLSANSAMFPRDVLASLPSGIDVYRGSISGNAESWARLVVVNGEPRGLIWDGSQMYAVEPGGDNAIAAPSTIIYRVDDLVLAPGSMTCAADSHSGSAGAVVQKLKGELSNVISRAPGAVEEITVGAIGDFEFFSMHGASSSADIVARLNNVDGIFSQELGIQITVPTVEVFTDAADPFSDATFASDLLDEVALYRLATPAQNSLGLTHLYTGRDLDGSTAGVAYNGVLCDNRFGAGLSEGDAGLLIDSLIAAHELGHNFGAPHDGQEGSACAAEPMSFIMAPSVNPNSSGFSDCTKIEVADDIAAASCIVALPTVDMAMNLDALPSVSLFGASESYEFDIRNNGLNTATNVDVEITLPGNLTFESVSPAGGDCTNGAGVVSCDFGDFTGQTSATVVVNAAATSVGEGDVQAIITTDFDERPTNNVQVVSVTVNPAVDLVVTSAPAGTLQLNSSMTVSAIMENRATLNATNSTITLTLGAGLRADSATWSIGNCTVNAQQVNCQANSFDSGENATLDVSVTGVSAGRNSYEFVLDASEADTNPLNNTVSGTIRVNDPENDDSGSGSLGLPLLILLGGVALRGRRRRS